MFNFVRRNIHSAIGVQVSFAVQLDSFLTQVKKQREQLLDLSADVQLQVYIASAANLWTPNCSPCQRCAQPQVNQCSDRDTVVKIRWLV
jgi:hypothetical protein